MGLVAEVLPPLPTSAINDGQAPCHKNQPPMSAHHALTNAGDVVFCVERGMTNCHMLLALRLVRPTTGG